MGYAIDVALSIPITIILYMLTEKIIQANSEKDSFNKKIQKNFIISFIIGLSFIGLGYSIFDQRKSGKRVYNRAMQYAMYATGILLIFNSMVLNWDVLDDNTKIVILMIMFAGFVLLSFRASEWKGDSI